MQTIKGAEANARHAYEQFIHVSRYARYRPEDKRRESYTETVERLQLALRTLLEKNLAAPTKRVNANRVLDDTCSAILAKEVMPSMRCLMTAGPALERDNVAGYNCAYVPVDDVRVFDEIMYILLCGTGVGFSVERQYITKLPEVPDTIEEVDDPLVVTDSKIGWAKATREYINGLYKGYVPKTIDVSRVRPAGAPLKTFGGRASGPTPLLEVFAFIRGTFEGACGRKLTSLECHDIVCKIAESVVCGGVRRSALLSLSNLTDARMRGAKSGEWYFTNPQRQLANNSVCYTEKPDIGIFMKEWLSLYESKSGERGIFSREACVRNIPSRREKDHAFGTNPCSEIVLRPRQFCNLTEVVCRPSDTMEELERKVALAAFLGTVQSLLTDFRYLSKRWKDNTEEERLLGVSLTGIMDCPLLNGERKGLETRLENLKEVAVDTNKKWAKEFGIPQSAAVTCVKPSGTVSQLVNSSSGIHPRYAPYYVRRVRNDVKDPVSQALIDMGVPYEVDTHNNSQYVFSFPVRSPKSARTIKTMGAVEQLELWKIYDKHWCEHKPSISVYVKEDEWLEVATWVYKNFNYMSGVSFFPVNDHIYAQAPYEEITKDEYKRRLRDYALPRSIYSSLPAEGEDTTSGSQEYACVGGACEL